MSARPPVTFFESAENLRSAFRACTNRSLSAGAAKDASICLQQGRLFFESAQESGIEIRPLQLFYGALAFAKAVTLVTKGTRLATLAHAHGLKDITTSGARLKDLSLKIEGRGTFQEFNDAVARENRLRTHDQSSTPITIPLPTSSSIALEGSTLTMMDIMARIPSLSSLYFSTFGQDGLSQNIQCRQDTYGFWRLQLWPNAVVNDLEDVQTGGHSQSTISSLRKMESRMDHKLLGRSVHRV